MTVNWTCIRKQFLKIHHFIENHKEASEIFLKPFVKLPTKICDKNGNSKNIIDLKIIGWRLKNEYEDPWDYIYDVDSMFDVCRTLHRKNTKIMKQCDYVSTKYYDEYLNL
jgi:hypothetical protein